VIKGGLLLMSLALLLISTAADLTQLLVFIVPLSLSGTTVATVITSALTKAVREVINIIILSWAGVTRLF